VTYPFLEKFSSVGAVVAAAACPICFPKVALVGAVFGLAVFAPLEGFVAIGIQAFFLLAFVGQVLAFHRHRNRWLLALSITITLFLFVGYYVYPSSILLQLSLAGLMVASVWLMVELRRCSKCAVHTTESKADA
jgi:mercuric ion transport protein